VSLRARLIAVLLAITTVAMLALAAITYTSQRGALLDRVDEQLETTRTGALVRLTDENDVKTPAGVSARKGPHGGAYGDGPGDDGVPPGTYAELRAASGAKVGRGIAAREYYEADTLAPPSLPATLRNGMTFIAESAGDDGVRYRVRTFEAWPLVGRAYGGYGAAAGPDGAGVRPTLMNASAATQAVAEGLVVVAVPLSDVDATLSRLLRTEAIVIGIALALLTALAWWLVRVGLRPLERMATTAGEIAAGDLDQRVQDATPKTETGRLGLALNGMLARLESAFAEREASEGRLRQFLSDASHELRTPLASIRGYAELFRVGAVREPDDVKKAMGRIEDEAARMGTLVEDLLVLARLDEAPEKERTPVDVALLAEDAADDARAIDPERSITVETDGEALVLGDDGQLRQVLGNLVRNALVHTPAGGPIEIRSRVTGEHATLEVRDHGLGLPAEDPEALFGRFWRAEGGRTRGKSGAGLGLAIVAAVVDAHGGEVHAENVPDGGASFTVRLPLAPRASPPPDRAGGAQASRS
jgi:two-component system OmpR family sensor kinase